MRTTAARRPFADHTQGATEALLFETSPKFGALTAAIRPLRVKERQIRVDRALAGWEDLRSLASQNLANELAAMAYAADDLLDRHALSGEGADRGVCLLASQIAFVLQLFRAREQLRAYGRRPDRAADRAHGFAHGVEERGAGVLHQMPSIGDLYRSGKRFRGRLAVAAATITGDDLYAGTSGQPSLHRRDLAIREQRHDLSPLQIADNRAVTMVSAKSPIIDASNRWSLSWWAGSSPHDAQQRVIADRQHESLGEAGRRPGAKR